LAPKVSRASLYFCSSDKLYLAELEVWDNEGGRIPDSPNDRTVAAEVIDGFWSTVK
jgi:hypothetical protein